MPIDYNKPRKKPAPSEPTPSDPLPPPQQAYPIPPPPPPPQHHQPPPPSYPPPAPQQYGQPYPPAPPYPPPAPQQYAQPHPPPPSYPPPAPHQYGQPYPPAPPYPPPAPQQYGQPYPPAPPPAQPGVSLSKVTLTKQAPAVSLTKGGGAAGIIRANLNWTQRQSGGGFFKRMAAGGGEIDLDLGCLFEFADGDKGVVQALGNQFEVSPLSGGPKIIWLSGDDRSGASQGGEDLFIDLSQANHIRRILIFAFIYEGTPNWAGANAVVTVFPHAGPQIEVRLDEHDPQSRMCAIAMLTNTNGEITINREVRYIRGGQKLLDQTYGWGMDWTPGRK